MTQHEIEEVLAHMRSHRNRSYPPTPGELELVLAHMRARKRSQSSPPTGYHPMSDEHYRACIAALRHLGYKITGVVVTQGDRAHNETGYLLQDG